MLSLVMYSNYFEIHYTFPQQFHELHPFVSNFMNINACEVAIKLKFGDQEVVLVLTIPTLRCLLS